MSTPGRATRASKRRHSSPRKCALPGADDLIDDRGMPPLLRDDDVVAGDTGLSQQDIGSDWIGIHHRHKAILRIFIILDFDANAKIKIPKNLHGALGAGCTTVYSC